MATGGAPGGNGRLTGRAAFLRPDWQQQKKKKRSRAVGLQSYSSLAGVAVRCLCELLLALPHFNFHNNIIVILAPLMNSPAPKVSSSPVMPSGLCGFQRVRRCIQGSVTFRCRLCVAMRSGSSSSRTRWAGLLWRRSASSLASPGA